MSRSWSEFSVSTETAATDMLVFLDPLQVTEREKNRLITREDFFADVLAGSVAAEIFGPATSAGAQLGVAGGNVLRVGTDLVSWRAKLELEWDDAGVVQTGLLVDVTDTASAAGSRLMDLKVDGSSKWYVTATGYTTQAGGAVFNGGVNITPVVGTVALSLEPVWNSGVTTFAAQEIWVTDTASAAGSLLVDWKVGGTSQWKCTKGGATTQLGSASITGVDPGTVSNGQVTIGAGVIRAYYSVYAARFVAAGGTVTDPTPVIDLSQTWNDAADTMVAFKANIVDSNSAAASLLMDLQVGSTSMLSVRKDGHLNLYTSMMIGNTASGTDASGFGIYAPASSANCFIDCKAQNGGNIIFQCGHNTEAGNARAFMVATASSGLVNFLGSDPGTAPASGTVNIGGGVIRTAGSIVAGTQVLAQSIELGDIASGSDSFIDFHATGSVDFNARIVRNSGANGTMILANTGTGAFVIQQGGAGDMVFKTDDTTRFTITYNGYNVFDGVDAGGVSAGKVNIGAGVIRAAGAGYVEGAKRVACGGGTTGSGTTPAGTVTLEINGTLYTLLRA